MSWRPLFMQWMPWALVLALARAGRSMPARIAMMAMTTSSSISVNAPTRVVRLILRLVIKLFGLSKLYRLASMLSILRIRGCGTSVRSLAQFLEDGGRGRYSHQGTEAQRTTLTE